MKENKEYPEQVVRANALITSKYTSSLTENKLMVLALKMAKVGADGRATARIHMKELQYLPVPSGHSFYETVRSAAEDMVGRSIFLEDRAEQHFLYINIIHKAEFQNGILDVTFTPEVNKYLYNLKDNFTSMSLELLWSFNSNYSYRLYEILKTHMYKVGADNMPYPVIYGISELKLQLNCINTEEKKVKEELRKQKPDMDLIVNQLVRDKKYEKWYEFKRKVLDKAVQEINEISDMNVDFEPVKSGRGGKVVKVCFYITRNASPRRNLDMEEMDRQKISREMQLSMLVDEVVAIIHDIPITQQAAIALLNAAENDLNKIQKAYDLSRKQSEIRNLIGWMTDAIRYGYEEPIELVEGSQEKAQVQKEFREIMEEREESLSDSAWKIVKQKEDFYKFEAYLQATEGLTAEVCEEVFNSKKCMEIYGKWIREGKPE